MNDLGFPDDSRVEVRYPLTPHQAQGDRAAWPWVPGWVISECGPDEWEICVQAPELAGLDEEGETVYPTCFRDASELRHPDQQPWLPSRTDLDAATHQAYLLRPGTDAELQAEAEAGT